MLNSETGPADLAVSKFLDLENFNLAPPVHLYDTPVYISEHMFVIPEAGVPGILEHLCHIHQKLWQRNMICIVFTKHWITGVCF